MRWKFWGWRGEMRLDDPEGFPDVDSPEPAWPACDCRWPRPGPDYWSWRCMSCGGEIR